MSSRGLPLRTASKELALAALQRQAERKRRWGYAEQG